jgi:hypothetical protein
MSYILEIFDPAYQSSAVEASLLHFLRYLDVCLLSFKLPGPQKNKIRLIYDSGDVESKQ